MLSPSYITGTCFLSSRVRIDHNFKLLPNIAQVQIAKLLVDGVGVWRGWERVVFRHVRLIEWRRIHWRYTSEAH